MAKTNITHKKVTTEKISIKDGIISDDGESITYLVNDMPVKTSFSELIGIFSGKIVSFSIGEKDIEDIEEID